MPGTVYPPVGAVRSVQRGTISIPNTATSGTATITAVNTAKSDLRFLGNSSGNNTTVDSFSYVVLTNSTTITANRGSSVGTVYVSWELTERY